MNRGLIGLLIGIFLVIILGYYALNILGVI